MTKIRIHELGMPVRNFDNTASSRPDPKVREYRSVEEIPHPFDRAQVRWLLEHGETNMHMGSTIYEVVRDQAERRRA